MNVFQMFYKQPKHNPFQAAKWLKFGYDVDMHNILLPPAERWLALIFQSV